SARAILLTDSESRASAMNERTRTVGLVEGTSSAMLKMSYLDRTSEIQIGDLIMSSGVGGIYPKGIPIGKVELVSGEKDRPSLYALVKPNVEFPKLEEVLCVSSLTGE
ncbi:MAG: rod shape-determining protein MreC, partial [Candidatus Omnitrophica bacterium]|nr:rod shape-determining protein MreC [Candidatus Omnitrophota bacterium]